MKHRTPEPRRVRGQRKVRIGNVIEGKGRVLFEPIGKNNFVLFWECIVKRIAERVRRRAMSAAGVGEKDENAFQVQEKSKKVKN